VAAVLLDIDGVLHVSGVPIAGAPVALQRLRHDGHTVGFLTNNTIRARATLAGELQRMGFDLTADEIETTPLAAGRLLEGARVLPLTARAIHEDLAPFVTLVDADADVVLVGGADETPETAAVYAYERLNQAFAELVGGARLVALHKNRWWQTSRGAKLDGGSFVTALEYAADVDAELVGKPSPAYFEAAVAALGVEPAEATMVGDDVESDVSAAIGLGMRGVLVQTGKFREETLANASRKPDAVIGSISALPDWLSAHAESGR
jgi:HAD superfamily hydrolase (TIGR01458 family)